MADVVFNIAKGRVNEYYDRVANNDPANSAIVVVLLKAAEADATLIDYDDLSTLLAAGGNTECDFTNYARQVYTDADITAPSPDDSADDQEASITQKTISNAGGTTDNTLAKAIICYDSDTTSGTDANLIPLTAHDASETTNGQDLVIAAGIVFRAS